MSTDSSRLDRAKLALRLKRGWLIRKWNMQKQHPPMCTFSYSKYMQKKAADAANRRHFIERMERLKNTRGLSFTIPQVPIQQNTYNES